MKDAYTGPAFELVLDETQLENLGRFTAIWSQIDHMMFLSIAAASGIRGLQLLSLIEGTTSGQRVAMLRRLIPLMESEETKAKADDFCASLGGLMDKRNHVMHGVWGLFWDYSTDKLHPACAYEKARNNHLYASQLADFCTRATRVSWKARLLLEALDPRLEKTNGHPVRYTIVSGPIPNGRKQPEWKPRPSRRSSRLNPSTGPAKPTPQRPR